MRKDVRHKERNFLLLQANCGKMPTCIGSTIHAAIFPFHSWRTCSNCTLARKEDTLFRELKSFTVREPSDIPVVSTSRPLPRSDECACAAGIGILGKGQTASEKQAYPLYAALFQSNKAESSMYSMGRRVYVCKMQVISNDCFYIIVYPSYVS